MTDFTTIDLLGDVSLTGSKDFFTTDTTLNDSALWNADMYDQEFPGSTCSPPTSGPSSPFSDLSSPSSNDSDMAPFEFNLLSSEFAANDLSMVAPIVTTINPMDLHADSLTKEFANAQQIFVEATVQEPVEAPKKKKRKTKAPAKRTTRKRQRTKKNEATATAVTLPREKLLKMSSKELDEYIEGIKSKRELTGEEEKDLKRQRRLIKNRESAHLSRQRRKHKLAELEATVSKLKDENCDLKDDLKKMSAENVILKEEVARLNKVLHSGHAVPPQQSSLNRIWKAVSIQKSTPSIKTAGVYLMIVLLSFGLFFSGSPGGNVFNTMGGPAPIMPMNAGVVISDQYEAPPALLARGGARDILQVSLDKGDKDLYSTGVAMEDDDFVGLKRNGLDWERDSGYCGGSKSYPIVVDVVEDPIVPIPGSQGYETGNYSETVTMPSPIEIGTASFSNTTYV